jgi:hypothetical protein
MNKIKLNVVKEVKVDGRSNNTGRPVNKKSARQIRLAKQSYYANQNSAFMNGNTFNILNTSSIYKYVCNDDMDYGVIVNHAGSYVCSVNYIGRTKVLGYTHVLNKRVNVEINLKEVTFQK